MDSHISYQSRVRNGIWQQLGTGSWKSGLGWSVGPAGDSARWQALGPCAGDSEDFCQSQRRVKTHAVSHLLYSDFCISNSGSTYVIGYSDERETQKKTFLYVCSRWKFQHLLAHGIDPVCVCDESLQSSRATRAEIPQFSRQTSLNIV